jgi:hypothetical protein
MQIIDNCYEKYKIWKVVNIFSVFARIKKRDKLFSSTIDWKTRRSMQRSLRIIEEIWPNTAARLAGWRRLRRVTQQDVFFFTWLTVHAACPDGPNHFPWSGADLLLNVHKKTPSWATSRKEGMAWYSSIDPCLLPGYEYHLSTQGGTVYVYVRGWSCS